MEKQKTIGSTVSISGTGLHSGKKVTLTFKPAPSNYGYKFKRIDIQGHPVIKADIDNVTYTPRGTNIEQNGIQIQTIEHSLAAIIGLGIDNILIEINDSETPIMDGSSEQFVKALLKAGIIEQEAEKKYLEIDKNIIYKNPDKNIEIIAIPNDEFKLSVMIDYKTEVLGTQNASLNRIKDFEKEIAPSRTFAFLHELEKLLDNNLIKGGNLNNAIIFVDKSITHKKLEQLAKVFNRPKVEVPEKGILNNLKLKFPNEPARHKLLDLLGDIALLGNPIKAHIIANRPGHYSNIQFAKLIRQYIIKVKKRGNVPIFNPNIPPLYDINKIRKILPHRPPFLLIDKILEMSNKHVIGLKNVTMNENFFIGHFPDEPVMPGVLQIEAMAQTGGVLALSFVPDPENYTTYFLKIDDVRFRQKVIPGDTLIFRLDMLSPIRRGICQMKGIAYVGNKIVMEAELLAQIRKIKK
jgi:UDP-3-O-[3-hydroxymyristoyl] N-acetylglucosamine deacetylase/3-hydroxyacyl-[acyl-carrier-protein] dehydratase